jgi:hypothetical protein
VARDRAVHQEPVDFAGGLAVDGDADFARAAAADRDAERRLAAWGGGTREIERDGEGLARPGVVTP